MPARFWAKRSEVERLKKEAKKLRDDLRKLKAELEVLHKAADEQLTLLDALNAHNAVDNERVYEPECQLVTRVILQDAIEKTRCRCNKQLDQGDGAVEEIPTRQDQEPSSPIEAQMDADQAPPTTNRDSSPEESSVPSSGISGTGRYFFEHNKSSRSSSFDPVTKHEPMTPCNAAAHDQFKITPSRSCEIRRKPVSSKSPPIAQTITVTPRGLSKIGPVSSRLDFLRERFESSVRDYHIRRYG